MTSAERFSSLMTLFGIAPQGVCSRCLSLIDIDDEGNIKPHSATRWGHNPCDGAGQAPRISALAAEPQATKKERN